MCFFFSTSNRWVRVYSISRLWDAKKSWFTNKLYSQFSKRTTCLSNLEINWIQKKFLWQPIGLGLRPRPILAVVEIFFIQLFPNWTACSPITYTNSQGQLLLFLHKKGDYLREAIIVNISVERGDYLGKVINRGRAIIWGNMVLYPVYSLIYLFEQLGPGVSLFLWFAVSSLMTAEDLNEIKCKLWGGGSQLREGCLLACVASVSNLVIRESYWERKQKKGWRGMGRGEEETLARKPHDCGKRPLIFHGSVPFVNWQLVKIEA